MSQKAASCSLAEAVIAFEDGRRQLIETLRGELEKFARYYRLPNPAASELRSRLSQEIRRVYPAEFSAYLDRNERVAGEVEAPTRFPLRLSLDEKARLYRASQITARDLLLESRDLGMMRLSDDVSRKLGPTTATDLAKRAALAHPASWKALPRREREAARLLARRIEKRPMAVMGRPRYAGETTVLEAACAISASLANSGVRLSDLRVIPFTKVGDILKGRPVNLLRAAVSAALPVTGLPTDRYLRHLLTRRR